MTTRCCAGLECEIDIQKTVEEARASRSGMVQTEEQYKFVYDVITHYIETQKARIVAQVRSESRPHTSIMHQRTAYSVYDDQRLLSLLTMIIIIIITVSFSNFFFSEIPRETTEGIRNNKK